MLEPMRKEMSEVVHRCAVQVLGLPVDKRFHRFFPMTRDDFPTPAGRSERYTIVEITMFEGRSVATKKAFYEAMFTAFEQELAVVPQDLEIVLVETPRHDWGIRGLPGDELALSYAVQT